MKRQIKKVYLVGAGPGHPELLTLRAVRCLQRADVVLHDHLIPPEVLLLHAPQARLVYVGKKASFHTLEQDSIEDLLVKFAQQGKTVVRLKGGDPYIFGRGGEEAERLIKEKIPFEVVPGISSALAGPLYAGIPLSHRKFNPDIAIVTGHEAKDKEEDVPYRRGEERGASRWINWEAVSQMSTIVILMGMGNLRANMKKLLEYGRSAETPAAVVRWAGTGKQRTVRGTVGTIADLVKSAGLTAPGIIVVGEVASLDLNFFEKSPLSGSRVLITRESLENISLSARLWEEGAEAISFPTFTYQKIPLTKDMASKVRQISRTDWIVFSSRSAVTFFLEKYDKIFPDRRQLMKTKIAAVGESTAQTLRDQGLPVDLLPKESSQKGLSLEKVFSSSRKLKILFPAADDARTDFYDALKTRHKITCFPIYKKRFLPVPAGLAEKLKKSPPDYAIFFSPSAVKNVFERLKREYGSEGKRCTEQVFQNVRFVVIGKTTAEALQEYEFSPFVVSRQPTVEGVIEAMSRKR